MLLLWCLTWLSLSLRARAARVNVTIDDTIPDPVTGNAIVYEPAAAWNDGAKCVGCTAHPNESKLYNGTWHDSTFNPLPGSNDFPNTTLSASATFNGTAVYVICVLARTTSGPSGNSDMTFFMDGALVGTFGKPAPGTAGYDYDVIVYSNTSLTPDTHTITVRNGHVNGPKSLVMLDRIVYTTGSDTPSDAKHSLSPGVIAAAVVCSIVGAVALALAAFLLFRYRKRRREDKEVDTQQVNAFPAQLPPNTYGNTFGASHQMSNSLSVSDSNSNPVSSDYQVTPLSHNISLNPNRRVPSGAGIYDPYYGYQSHDHAQPNAGYAIGGTTKAERRNNLLDGSGSSQSAAATSSDIQRPFRTAGMEPPPAYYHSEAGSSSNGRSGFGDRKI